MRIVAGNRLGHFRLDSRQELHIVRVESALDRETTTTYNLTVEAADLGKGLFTNYVGIFWGL